MPDPAVDLIVEYTGSATERVREVTRSYRTRASITTLAMRKETELSIWHC
jgi:hypothetical protein